jgi:single-strand DNA-binding protein
MSVNKVILIGNVGKDPDVRYLDNHVCVANLTLATTERGYTAQNGTQVPDRTEWHNLVFWRGLAETVEKYVHKGDKLYVEGSIRNRSYDDQNGVKRYVTEIFVDTMEMLSSRQPKQDGQQPAASAPGQPESEGHDIPF